MAVAAGACRLDMEEAPEEEEHECIKSPRKHSRSISPAAAPEQEPPPIELPAPKKPKVSVYRAVSFQSADHDMSDKKLEADKDPKGKEPAFDHNGERDLVDSDLTFLLCEEAQEAVHEPVVETEAGSDFATVKFGSHRLIDSAKKFSNPEKAEKTPLKSSTTFNTAALLRSASTALSDMFQTPPTNKRPPIDMRTPSKCSCSMSQPDVFSEDSSSDEEDDM